MEQWKDITFVGQRPLFLEKDCLHLLMFEKLINQEASHNLTPTLIQTSSPEQQ